MCNSTVQECAGRSPNGLHLKHLRGRPAHLIAHYKRTSSGLKMSVNIIKVNNSDTNYTHSIFDISGYTGNQYEDLSSALTAVPEEKQSGGMTVRFI